MRKLAALLLVLVSAGIFAGTLIHATWYHPEESIAVPITLPPPSAAFIDQYRSPPYRLNIPKLSIYAGVQRVGIKPNGQMANPSNFVDVGWYTGSSIPGNSGSSVFAGHFDNGLGRKGVFHDLSLLAQGDRIEIIDAEGNKREFEVINTRTYHKDDDAAAVFARDGPPTLNLITCMGTWIPEEKMYQDRLVVTAVPALPDAEAASTTPPAS